MLSFLAPRFFSGIDMSQTAVFAVVWMLRAHFSRRMLEVLFVHRYSGSMGTEAAIQICVMYSSFPLLLTYQLSILPLGELGALADRTLFSIGIAVFVVGTLINA